MFTRFLALFLATTLVGIWLASRIVTGRRTTAAAAVEVARR